MITIEALQEVYTALGGELSDTYEDIASGAAVSDYTTIPDCIAAIAQRAASAGIELPKVTSDDNSKLLTVVNGKWDKADAPSSSGGLRIIIAEYDSSKETYTLNMSYSEMREHINNGGILAVRSSGDYDDRLCYLDNAPQPTAVNVNLSFTSTWSAAIFDTTTISYRTADITTAGTITFTDKEFEV